MYAYGIYGQERRKHMFIVGMLVALIGIVVAVVGAVIGEKLIK